jgi:MFS family permease
MTDPTLRNAVVARRAGLVTGGLSARDGLFRARTPSVRRRRDRLARADRSARSGILTVGAEPDGVADVDPSHPPTAAPRPPSRSAMAWGVALSLAVVAAASVVTVSLSVDAPLIREAFGLSETEIGAIASCVYIGAAASSVVAGRLTDGWGPGRVLVVVALVLAAGVGVAALAPTYWVFFGGVLLAGLGYGAVNPPTNVLANPRSSRRRGLAISIKQSGIPLGGAVAGLLIPPVAVQHGWRLSLLVPIGLCGLLALLFATLRPSAAPADQDELSADDAIRLRLPRAYVFGFLMGGVQVTIFTFLAVYLVDDRSMTPQQAGAWLALLLGGGLVGRIAWGWSSDRLHLDRGRVLQATALLSAAALALLPVVGVAALPVVLLVIGLCSVGWNGVYIASVTEAAAAGTVGLVTGRSMRLVNLGAVLIPPSFGLLVSTRHDWVLPWILCGALSLLSLCLLQFSRARPVGPVRRTAR